jgi:hypothetical protein
MKETTDDNILGSLKSLVWTAFISVVSFQLLAPQIWSYLHNLLGIDYQLSYWSFTLVYFLLAPLTLLIWFILHRRILVKFLPPFNKPGELDRSSKVFIWGFPAFILSQIFVTIWGFSLHWSNAVPRIILGIYFVINVVFLCLCFNFAMKFINGSGLKGEQLKKASNNFYKSYASSIVIGISLFVVALLFLNHWIENRFDGEKRLASSEAGHLGFSLQYINEVIGSRVRYIDSLSEDDSVSTDEHQLESTAKRGTIMVNAAKDSSIYIIQNTKLKAWGAEVSRFQDSVQPPLSKTDLNNQAKFSVSKFFPPSTKIADNAPLTKGDVHYLKMLKRAFLQTSQKLNKSTKFLLGIQLRSVQAKGMLMLMSVFFTSLSLYLYVSLISRVQQLQKKPDEEEIFTSTFVSNRLWLFLTVIAWLLIPIFKPIIDDNINVNAPFLSTTVAGDVRNILPGGGGEDNPGKLRHGKSDTTVYKTFNHDTDTIISKDTASAEAIKYIKKEIKTISGQVLHISRQVSHIENATNATN